MTTRLTATIIATAAATAGCSDRTSDYSLLTGQVDGDSYEIIPVTRSDITLYGPGLLIDLTDWSHVYVIDGTAEDVDMRRVPLICPNGMRTTLSDFLLGESIGWGDHGTTVVLSAGSLEFVLASVQQVVTDTCSDPEMICTQCPDGATLCRPEYDDGCGTLADALWSIWGQEYNEDPDHREGDAPPPAWNPPTGGDPTPFDAGDPWTPGSGNDGNPPPWQGSGNDGGFGGSANDGNGGGGSGGSDDGDSGGPDYW